MGWYKGPFMSSDLLEIPHNRVITVLLKEVEDVIICNTFLILIIVNGATELDMPRIMTCVVVVVLNKLHNLNTLFLSILIRIHGEYLANKVMDFCNRHTNLT